MNRGVLESSPIHHLPAAGNPNWWNNLSGGFKPPPPLPPPTTSSYLLPSPTSSSSSLPPSSNPNLTSCNWLETTDLPLDQPWSLSQLLLDGLMMGDEERMNQEKKLENREEVLRHQASMKQESDNTNCYVIIPSLNSPPNKSCLTIIHNNIQNGANLSECNNNSSEIGGSTYANKKPKLQLPSSQSTLKVRKEKLGGRIAALHQIVSPFGKTDTASVLSEAIGYIRFLHSQIEALSLPYLDTPTRNNMMQQHVDIFPEDPGQLVNEYCMKISNGASSSSATKNQEANPKEESKKDLRSRGLCLVPISCTLQVGSDNGADYWAPAFGITFR